METDWEALALEYTRRNFTLGDWVYGYQPVLELLGEIGGQKILDYGCGSGKFSRVLSAQGAQVIAVDPNEKMLALARTQQSERIRYFAVTDNDISFLDHVDAAVITYVLCTRREDKEIKMILKQIYDKLECDGTLVVLEPNPINRQGAAGIPLEIQLEGMKSVVFDYPRSIEHYVSLIKNSGFTIEEVVEPKNELKKPQMLLLKALKCIK